MGDGDGDVVTGSLEPTGRFSTAGLSRWWHAAARSDELARAPLGRVVFDVPVVLFRDTSGAAAALVDRCPHRNVPLSVGRCVHGQIECGYHGWRFDGAGRCCAVPGLAERGDPDRGARRVAALPVVESDGMVWVAVGAGGPQRPSRRALSASASPATGRSA
jgi:phenylpropionate dioxygenase-like ring-hydroxylating dioxygenase large terminal subunit